MEEIKPNMLAWVKTTGEIVYVLNVTSLEPEDDPDNKLLDKSAFVGKKAHCRVPVAGSDGIRHTVGTFLLEELETQSERLNREKAAYAAAIGDMAMSKAMPGQLKLITPEDESGGNLPH